MSFIYRWTRPPLLSLLIIVFGLSLLIQILVLFHGQNIMIIPYEYVLIFTSIGATFPLTGAVIIFADSLSKISGIPPSKMEKPVLISTGVVLSTFLALYYLPYGIAYLIKNLGPLDPLAHIPNPVKYVISINLAIMLIVFITLRMQTKAQTAVRIRRKKARKKR